MSVKEIKKAGDLRVEVTTKYPDPLLADKWAALGMMSKAWAEKNNAVNSADMTKNEENFATRNAMGTGPFMLKERRAGEKTILVANPNWWDKPTHNLTEVIFTPVANAATRVAALKAGDIDMMYEVPPADTETLKKDANINGAGRPETRVVYPRHGPGARPSCSSPTSRARTRSRTSACARRSIARSTSTPSSARVMRGQSYPTNLMVAPGINGYMKDLDKRPALLKPDEAKKLLADAGYPNGFEVGMDCPNDRYVNDEKICQAVVAMLAKIGVKVNLRAQTRNLYFAKILRKNDLSPGETSFYMLGWSPAQTYDVHNVFEALIQTPNKATKKGQFNAGGYSNPELDKLADAMEQETDKAKRDADDRRGDQALCRRLRLHSAAPAGGRVGGAQEHRPGPAGRQQLPAALRDGEVATPQHIERPAPGAAMRARGRFRFGRNPARPAAGPTDHKCLPSSCDDSCNPSPCC